MPLTEQGIATSQKSGEKLPYVVAALVVLAFIGAMALVDYFDGQRRAMQQRETVMVEATAIHARLEELLDASLSHTRGMAAEIIAHGGITRADFEAVAKVLLVGQPFVRNIVVSRGMVIAMVYPTAGNEMVVGIDYHNLPAQWDAIRRASIEHERIIQGPLVLAQGGDEALIFRDPVYLTGPNGGERFFGFVSVVADLPGIFDAAGLNRDDLPVSVAIRGADGQGAAGKAVFGDQTIFQHSPAIVDIRLPTGSWQLGAIPRHGWGVVSGDIAVSRAFESLLVLLMSIAAFVVARQVELRIAIRRSLRASEAKLRGLFDLSPLGIALRDAKGRNTEFNESFRHLVGYDSDELRDLDFWALTPPEYAAEERKVLECLRVGGRYGPFEKEYRRKDGSTVPVEELGVLVTGDDGESFVWSIVADISDRRYAERVAAREHLRMRTILQTASDGIHILDADGVLVDANELFLKMLGYGTEAFGTLRISDWAMGSAWDDNRAEREAVLASGRPWIVETRHRRRDGSILDVEISVARVEIDGVSYLYAASRDVTERRRAERELRIAAIAFESQEALIVMDGDGTIIRVNRAFSEVTGCSADEVIGRSPAMFRSGHHDAAFYADLWRSVRERGFWRGEIWARRKSGEAFPAWVTVTAVRGEAGESSNYVAAASDISLQRTEHLRQIAVEATLAEERERGAIAVDLHDGVGQMLYVAMIKLGLMAKELEEGSTASALADDLGDVLGEASKLVREATSRLSPPALKELGLVPALFWLAEETTRVYDIDVVVKDDSLPKPLTAAQSAILFRAVRELLINVAKHAGSDRALVTVSAASGRMRITVEDRGVGLSDWRATISERKGFGLASVQERILFLKGAMDVRANPGGGTVVTLELPFDPATAEPHERIAS